MTATMVAEVDRPQDAKRKPEQVTVKIAFIPGEFSISADKHKVFVSRIMKFCEDEGIDLASGTEASQQARNNTRPLLMAQAPQHGYDIFANPHGEWIMTAERFGRVKSHQFVPVIAAQGGKAAQGAHDVRGIVAQTIVPHDDRIGTVHNGVSHWLTKGTDLSTHRGHQNHLLADEIGRWGAEAGKGPDLAFYNGDTNRDDQHRDAFDGNPLTSCWDELGKWPVTHPHANGSGPTLDLIASLDKDGRVSCQRAYVLSDKDLPLPVDHFVVVAEYGVRVHG